MKDMLLPIPLTLFLVGMVIAGVMTYEVLNQLPLQDATEPQTLTLLLGIDLILLALLGALIAYRIVRLWIKHHHGQAGRRLHVRLVIVFSIIAAMPAILMTFFSAIFLDIGFQSWFSARVKRAVEESSAVASAYLREHMNHIRADIIAMANDLNVEALYLFGDRERFNQVINTQVALRGLTEAIVFNGTSRQRLAYSDFTFSLIFEHIPSEYLERARQGEVVLLVTEQDDRVRALVHLDKLLDTFLFVGRLIDPKVLWHTHQTDQAVRAYAALESSRANLQLTISLIFVSIALLLVLTAIWFGLNFATSLAQPISALIAAAERVRDGDLQARVPILKEDKNDEIAILSRVFNHMTQQIAHQRHELITANQQLDTRRRFTEAVLAGVSSSVLGLDQEGKIMLANQSAIILLGFKDGQTVINQPLSTLIPESTALMETMRRRVTQLAESQITFHHGPQEHPCTLLMRISAQAGEHERCSFIVTFDDITALLFAQRQAAWADVARRIAHEIKNPLTPIQLCAERLKKKYLHQITIDQEMFLICTNMIIRHVMTVGQMVDEFSAFARMPAAQIKSHWIQDLCRHAIMLHMTSHPEITFAYHGPDERLMLDCDARQITQALTNLLQNAVEAIEARPIPPTGTSDTEMITVTVTEQSDTVTIMVEDNGIGFPITDLNRLIEPYVTTRNKGTGLGLAIVHKIIQDHEGEIRLENRATGGGRVSLILPRRSEPNHTNHVI